MRVTNRILAFIGVVIMAVPLSGCITSKITPEQQINLINAFSDAGCKGTVHVSTGGATGQLGGGFHAEASLDGSCDPMDRIMAKPDPMDNPPGEGK